MRRFVPKRPTPALGVAFVALFVALSGLAVAGPSLPGTGRVHSNDIHDRNVRNRDIATGANNSRTTKNNSLGSIDVLNNSLTGGDVQDNSLTGADVNEATLGTVPSAGTAASATSAATAANADKLDGLDANQIARATTATATGSVDNFDAAAFTSQVSRSVTAPTAGILLIMGQMNVNRDADDADPTIVTVRGTLDGAAATTETNVRATELGTADQSVSVSGAVAVAAGTHTVALEAQEVSAGVAFLTERSITTLFVPFGDAGAAGTLSAKDSSENK